MVNILVTGANGFIGSHLCAQLKANGHHVIATSRHGGEGGIATGNLAAFEQWDAALEGIDCFIHLAARVHQTNADAAKDIMAFQRDNVMATEKLLRACERKRIQRFIFLSTIAVMGTDSGSTPFKTTDALKPFNPYSQSKADAEILLQSSSIDWQIIRIPLVYGAGVRANFLSLLRLSRSGIPLPFGAINNKRSILYISNLCDAITHLAVTQTPAQQILHIADANSLSTKEIIGYCAEGAGATARFFPLPRALLRIAASSMGKSELYTKLCDNLELDTSTSFDMLGWTPPYESSIALRLTAQQHSRA